MPRDGTGTFVRTNGTFSGADTWDQQATSADPTINSGRHDTHDQDIADAMTGSVPRDGQAGMAADLPMGGFKGTNVGDATLRNQWLTLGQRQDGDGVWCGTAGGTADALTMTPVTVAIPAYEAGMALRFTVNVDNTGAVSVNVSGLGARDLKDLFGLPLIAGSLKAGMTIEIVDTGTEFRFNGERKIITAQGDIIVGDVNGDPTVIAVGGSNTLLGTDGTKNLYYGGTAAKTADYTVIATDHKKTILVDATAGAITITLDAAATLGDGFQVDVQKSDSSVNIVSMSADGVETIDAPGGNRNTVALPSQFDRLKLVCDGTKFSTLEHRLTFDSEEQAIINGTEITLVHGLGVIPRTMQLVLRNITAEGGYDVGDEAQAPGGYLDVNASGAFNRGSQITASVSNLYITRGAQSLELYNRTNGAFFTINNANWRFVGRCEL